MVQKTRPDDLFDDRSPNSPSKITANKSNNSSVLDTSSITN